MLVGDAIIAHEPEQFANSLFRLLQAYDYDKGKLQHLITAANIDPKTPLSKLPLKNSDKLIVKQKEAYLERFALLKLDVLEQPVDVVLTIDHWSWEKESSLADTIRDFISSAQLSQEHKIEGIKLLLDICRDGDNYYPFAHVCYALHEDSSLLKSIAPDIAGQLSPILKDTGDICGIYGGRRASPAFVKKVFSTLISIFVENSGLSLDKQVQLYQEALALHIVAVQPKKFGPFAGQDFDLTGYLNQRVVALSSNQHSIPAPGLRFWSEAKPSEPEPSMNRLMGPNGQ